MTEWWDGLAGMTQFFYAAAAFFSVFFLWQVIGAFLGLADDDADFSSGVTEADDLDLSPDDLDHQDVVDSSQAFKLLSLRTIVTFFTLFFWMAALYTTNGMEVTPALGYASLWGLGGMFVVASILYLLHKMTESGTKDLLTVKGCAATVYLDIPADGYGEVKTIVNGASEHIKARSTEGVDLPAGTQVKIVQVMSQTLVGVVKVEKGDE
ncbi:hypothetical protein [Pontiella sp.]|uniref:hypothetical protein n=1 Tax=Pontiella sp. TaxID=2837462 RepID=UPI00356224C4